MFYPNVQYQGPAVVALLLAESPTVARELHSRSSDGIHVRLLWHPSDGHVSVAVDDTKTGDTFELLVRDGDRALDVFHHPYAYAAMCHEHAGDRSTTSTDTAIAAQ